MRTFRIGEDVLAPDGSRLGTVQKIVIDEHAHRVTHLVVEGHLVGLRRLREAGPDGLASNLDRAGLESLPAATGEHLSEPGSHWEVPSGYTIGDFLAIAAAMVGQAAYVPPIRAPLDPDGVHEITSGSPVWSGDAHLGEVERVLTDDEGGVAAFVLHRGIVFGGHVVVPIARVTEVVGNNVHTDLAESDLDALEKYTGT